MFNIEDNIIEVTRGDEVDIELTIEDYTFTKYDFVKFKFYKERRLNQEPLLIKRVDVSSETEKISVTLTSEDTKKLAEMKNRIIKVWYEVELNDKITVIGFDDDGAKIVKILPEGSGN